MASEKIRVVIADDHQLVLDGLESLLGEMANFEVVCTAVDGKEALESARIFKPDLLLLDIDMPFMTGLDVLDALRKEEYAGKIMILTMHAEAALIKRIMQLGADGYLLKTADKHEFEEAIKKILDGKKFFSQAITEILATDSTAPEAIQCMNAVHKLLTTLSDRETEILELIAQGLTNKQIGTQLFISHRTVDTHRTNLMKKLNLTNVAGLIKFAMKSGLVK